MRNAGGVSFLGNLTRFALGRPRSLIGLVAIPSGETDALE